MAAASCGSRSSCVSVHLKVPQTMLQKGDTLLQEFAAKRGCPSPYCQHACTLVPLRSISCLALCPLTFATLVCLSSLPRTLAHGYSLNHSTISVHRLLPDASLGVADFTEMIHLAGLPLNQEGGLIKVRQASARQSLLYDRHRRVNAAWLSGGKWLTAAPGSSAWVRGC